MKANRKLLPFIMLLMVLLSAQVLANTAPIEVVSKGYIKVIDFTGNEFLVNIDSIVAIHEETIESEDFFGKDQLIVRIITNAPSFGAGNAFYLVVHWDEYTPETFLNIIEEAKK